MKTQKLTALVGAQYGSEGKGVVAKYYANEYDVHVRTGGPNAGHTFSYRGQCFKMQSIPCGWSNPDASLVIGTGAVVNPRILERELRMLQDVGVDITDRLFIDPRATLLTSEHEKSEGHTSGEIHKRIGSTGEGVGAARLSRIHRNAKNTTLLGDYCVEHHPALANRLYDTARLLHTEYGDGRNILLEGTQGCGLSLVHGPWPYCTSGDTNAAQLCADAGLPPQWISDVILVARTYPIRVAGNSGPMKSETNWDNISAKMGKPTEERTTVTKLVRRVAEWDSELFAQSIRINAPTEVVLTFADYLDPEIEGNTNSMTDKVRSFVQYIESTFEIPVSLVGTGFTEENGWSCIKRK